MRHHESNRAIILTPSYAYPATPLRPQIAAGQAAARAAAATSFAASYGAKNTRPREEQRWVAGYFRGAAELGEVERSHYELRGGE